MRSANFIAMRSTREYAIPRPYRAAFHRVAPGVHTLPGQSLGRVYVLESSDGLTLVDTGLSWRSQNLLSRITRAGYSLQQVRRVLLTHTHADHVGGLRALQLHADVEVITSTENANTLCGRIRAVGDGDVLGDLFGGLTVVGTPGHAHGHLSFWLPELGVLFTGDTLSSLGGLGMPPCRCHADFEQTMCDVERLSRLDAAVICCGHGPPVTRNASSRLRAVARALHAERPSRVVAAS